MRPPLNWRTVSVVTGTSLQNVATTYELMPDVPAVKTVVDESGISAREELEELERVGVDAVLIGSALMQVADPEAKVRELTGSDGERI